MWAQWCAGRGYRLLQVQETQQRSTQVEVNTGKGAQVWQTLEHVLLIRLYRILQIPASVAVCMVIDDQSICYRHTTCCIVLAFLLASCRLLLEGAQGSNCMAENGFVYVF